MQKQKDTEQVQFQLDIHAKVENLQDDLML